MADRVSIAIRQEQALNRLNEGVSKLAERFGVDAPIIPALGRDPELLRAEQFEALADWVDTAVNAQADPSASPAQDYNALTKSDLVLLARQRGISLEGINTKAELVDALQAADGISEEQQAQMDKKD